jgi:apolipoprotein N-acyltransferase
LLAQNDDVGRLVGAQGRPQDSEHAENGCLLIEPDGKLSWPYSKGRLVAYGEVVPLKDAASFFDYPWGNYDLSAGRSAAPLRWREHVLGLSVCFDNLFSYLAREQVRDGAGSMLLMTNNSWYKLASGIRQHCDMDILRAVEYRRPLARVSTSGWSHIVLPSGKIAEQTQLNRPAVLTAKLLPGDTTTPYLVLSDLFAQLCLIAAIMLSSWALLAGKSEGIL